MVGRAGQGWPSQVDERWPTKLPRDLYLLRKQEMVAVAIFMHHFLGRPESFQIGAKLHKQCNNKQANTHTQTGCATSQRPQRAGSCNWLGRPESERKRWKSTGRAGRWIIIKLFAHRAVVQSEEQQGEDHHHHTADYYCCCCCCCWF